MKILVLNSGSSSQKAFLYEVNAPFPEDPPEPLWEGKLDWHPNRASLKIKTAAGPEFQKELPNAERAEATASLLEQLTSGNAAVLGSTSEIQSIGHRIVNGGREFNHPTRVTQEVKSAIEKMATFAPLHNLQELEGIALIEKLCPGIPQVAVFDTGFHRTLPNAAAIYPGPYEWAEQGIKRFGFHGINHQYCTGRAAQLLGKKATDLKLISCHLGNGCSLAAIHSGKSIDTTMGFTPLEGLMMGTRSGSVDPGILTYLMREKKLDAPSLDAMLNSNSGLLGISGVSADMREIIAAMQSGNQRAQLAFDIFIHRLLCGIGSMLAVLNGADALIFTAGIGENSSEVRSVACENFRFLGLQLDSEKNHLSLGQDVDIAADSSKLRVLVIRAQEDWAIAQECWRVVTDSGRKPS
jgi:acetate kinase